MKTVLYSKNQIRKAIESVGAEINSYYRWKDNTPIMIIPILKGGVFFYVDLVREFTFKNEMGVISTSHYPNGQEVRDIEIQYIDSDVKDKQVLLVDEICYTGKTLIKLREILLDRGALDVRTAVLINQPKEHDNILHIPTWSAIQYEGKEWVYGQGMDLKGLYRNLEDIVYDKD